MCYEILDDEPFTFKSSKSNESGNGLKRLKVTMEKNYFKENITNGCAVILIIYLAIKSYKNDLNLMYKQLKAYIILRLYRIA